MRLNPRKDKSIVENNCTVLSLGEAIKRWTSDGQFLMTEVNASDSYEADVRDGIDLSQVVDRVSKIELALQGVALDKEVQASSSKTLEPGPSEPAPEPAPASTE